VFDGLKDSRAGFGMLSGTLRQAILKGNNSVSQEPG